MFVVVPIGVGVTMMSLSVVVGRPVVLGMEAGVVTGGLVMIGKGVVVTGAAVVVGTVTTGPGVVTAGAEKKEVVESQLISCYIYHQVSLSCDSPKITKTY